MPAGGGGTTVGGWQCASSGEVIAAEQRSKVGVRRKSASAIRRIREGGSGEWAAVGIQADGVSGRIDDGNGILLGQKGRIIIDSDLDVVMALHVRQAGARARVSQPSVLPDGLRLQLRSEGGKRIGAGIVVILI